MNIDTPLETLRDLANQPHPASQWEQRLAQELLDIRTASTYEQNVDAHFCAKLDPNSPSNRHVTLDERSVYFPLMKVEEFDLKAVPHCLSNICRYNGFVNRYYSVAQHSVMVCELAEAEYGRGSEIARCALLHDATEAYLGDISRPLKAHLPDYQKLEAHVHSVIIQALGLPSDPEVWKQVSRFDVMALMIEANHILFHRYPWVKAPDPTWRSSTMAKSLAYGAEMLPAQAKLEMVLKLRQYGYEI